LHPPEATSSTIIAKRTELGTQNSLFCVVWLGTRASVYLFTVSAGCRLLVPVPVPVPVLVNGRTAFYIAGVLSSLFFEQGNFVLLAMARKRRDKRPRLPQPGPDVSAIPEIEPGADNVEETQLLIRRRVALKGKVALKERIIDDNEQISDLPSPEWCEDNISFCCAVCRCHDKREGDDQYIVPTNDSLAHRKCCHGAADSDMEWVPLFQEAITRGSDICLSNKEKLRDPACLEWVTKKAIHDAYKTSRSQESALYNADADLSR
jgi:hypothetical protein